MNLSGQPAKSKTNQNIQVYLRCRPTNSRERQIKSNEVVEVSSNREVTVRQGVDSKITKKFTFDRAFAHDSKQNEVYSVVVAPLIEEVLAGYNCTVFAYGQTGTGKTYTMVGEEAPELGSSWEDDSMTGIIPRALSHLFDELRMMEVEFSMRISYLELYNEELCDLLSTDDIGKIRIYDDANKKGSVIVQGLEEIPVHSKNDVYKLLAKGQERRKTAATLMNATSSRSHTVFSILVHIKESGLDGEEMLKTGKLNLVDLAGSENISKAGNEKGIRTRETVNINQSLLTLGRVITALVERTPHIPYRESKLTRLLQESLGGRTKTSIIATISPGHKDLEETLSTLEYAHRAKNIQNKPEINQRLTKRTVLKEYTEEIDRLKRDLMASRDKNGIYLAEETYNDMVYKLENTNKELNDKACLMRALKDEMSNKQALFNEVSLNLAVKTEELKEKDQKLKGVQSELGQTQRVLKTTKRKVVEKKFLLDKHVKTEEVLMTQACELKKVAETVKGDAEGLHESIARRTKADEQTSEACDKFVQHLHTNLTFLRTNVNELVTSHTDQSKMIVDEIEANLKEQNLMSDKLLSKIQTFEASAKKSTNDCADFVLTHKLSAEIWSAEQLKGLNDLLSAVAAKEEAHQKEIQTFTTAIQADEAERAEKFKAHQLKIANQLMSNDENTQKFVDQHKSCLTSLSSEIRQLIATSTQQLKSTIAVEKVNRQKQKSQISELQKMLAHLSTTIAENDANEVEMEKIVSSLTGSEATVDNGFTTVINHCLNHHNQTSADLKECQAQTEASQVMSADALQTRNEQINRIAEVTALNCEQVCGMVTKTRENLEVFGANQTEQLEKLSANVSECTAQAIDTLTVNQRELADIVGASKEMLNNEVLSTICLNEQLQRVVRDYETTSKEKLFETEKRMEAFHENEVVIYSSAGETPVKKDYQFPSKFVATSPHDRMLRRFRLERSWPDLDTSSVISEDIEGKDDTITEDSLVNSTPLRPIQNYSDDIKPCLKDLHISDIHSKSQVIIIDDDDEDNKENY